MGESKGDVQAYVELAQHMLAVARAASDQVGVTYWSERLEHWRDMQRGMSADMKG